MSNLYRKPSKDVSYQMLVPLGKGLQRRHFFRNQPIRNKNCLWRPFLKTDRDEISHLYRVHSINASYKVSVHLGKRFQSRIFFRNRPIRNKNCLWRQCLLTDRDEMSNHYREPSIDASYQVSVHWTKRFWRTIFLEIDQSEKRIACDGHVFKRIRMKWTTFIEVIPRMIPTKFWFIWESGCRGEHFFRNQPIRNKNCMWRPCLLTDHE